MLAKRRRLLMNGAEVERTPLLVPSFSSKGFPDVQKIIEYSSEIIDGPTLVSAYDLHYEKIRPPFDFPSLIFLDSGGYEISKDTDLSDLGERDHEPKQWSEELHEGQLAAWRASVPTVLISYDHPKERLPVADQIERARRLNAGNTPAMREILLKPETATQRLLSIGSILKNIHRLADFDVIGVTEKEIGNSVLSRMENIIRLRSALEDAGLEMPIHVFGSLDTISTPLYFLAGADIFDGLTWLRFAFHEGQTIYKQNYGALEIGVGAKAHVIDGTCWNHNYYYMRDLELEMRRFLNGNDFASFRYNRELFRESLKSAMEAAERCEHGR